jgi:hypothetical protein
MTRVQKHVFPKRRIAGRLRRAGFKIRMAPASASYDFLVNDRVRVALRVAFPRLRKHHVTARNQRYTYRYRSWHFNFHHHGQFGRRYADVVICLAMEPKHPRREQVFVIPWSSVSGKTFSLHSARHEYSGRYAPYRNRWEVINEVAADAPLRQVA